MSEGGRSENGCGSGRVARFTASEGVITYKRKKCGLEDSESGLRGDPNVSSGEQKPMEKVHDTLMCNGIHEVRSPSRIHHHWRTLLEELLLSLHVNCDGVQSCIHRALSFGHFNFIRKPSTNAATAGYPSEANGNLKETKRVNNILKTARKCEDSISSGHQRVTGQEEDFCAISKKCQNVLIEVLASENFALLCDLLLENFPGIKVDSILDLSQINSKMKNGDYGLSAGPFHQDLQQIWERIRRIGQEMTLLAASLSKVSQAPCNSQGKEEFGVGTSKQEYQKLGGVGMEEKNSMDSYTTTQLPCESDRSTKPEQAEASLLYKVSNCKECGIAAYGKCSLICDGCEAMYHFSCIMPDVQGIPVQNWFCPLCTREKKESSMQIAATTTQGGPHESCVVCDRLEASGMIEHTEDGEDAVINESRESSVSIMDSEGSPQPTTTTVSRLCKNCGACEDDEKRFIVCGHSLCPYKYYHIQCLKTSQLAIQQQNRQACWYCPSCLCRSCLNDKDDDMIALCDGCDEAYHTYCMKPPCTSVPKGKWYCVPCNIQRAKQGMKNYEQWVLQQHNRSGNPSNESNRSMDLLVSAAEKVERLAAARKRRR